MGKAQWREWENKLERREGTDFASHEEVCRNYTKINGKTPKANISMTVFQKIIPLTAMW